MPTSTESPSATTTEKEGAVKARPGETQRSDQEQAVIEASAAASPQALEPETVQSATEWFLSDEMEQPTILYFDVNVAASGLPAQYIRWGVRALGRQEIKNIRRDAADPNTGVEDDMEVNMRVLIKSAVDPNFEQVAKERGIADPADLVNQRFAHKPGVIEAIARKANEMSGYGNAHIIRPVDAAGN